MLDETISIEAAQTPSPIMAEAVDLDGVAAMLSVSRSSAKNLASEGRLPEPALSIGKIRRWWRIELSAWLAAQCPPRAKWAGMRAAAIRQYMGNARGAA